MARLARAEIFDPSEIVAVHLMGNTVDASRRSVAALCPGLKCCCPVHPSLTGRILFCSFRATIGRFAVPRAAFRDVPSLHSALG
jgi:hypothetical protein